MDKLDQRILYCTDLNAFKLDSFRRAFNLAQRLGASFFHVLLGMDVDDIERVFSTYQYRPFNQTFDDREQVLLTEINAMIDAYYLEGKESTKYSIELMERKSLDYIYTKIENEGFDMLIIDSFTGSAISDATFKKTLIEASSVTVIVLGKPLEQ